MFLPKKREFTEGAAGTTCWSTGPTSFAKCDDVAVTFELLEHPADIGFRARGATLEELFASCACALVSIILDPSAIRPIESIAIPGVGEELESLLVNWLNEVLYYVDGRRLA